MKLLFMFLVFAAVAVLYFIYPIKKAIKISKEIEKDTVAYEQYPQNPSMKILVTGDSTAFGTGVSDMKESTAGRLGNDFPEATIQNISENGLKIEGLVEKIKSLPDSSSYDVILIQIGANDVTGVTSLKKVKEDLSQLMKLVTSKSERIIILTSGNIGLSPVFRAPLSQAITKRTLLVREIFLNEVKLHESVQYVDLFKVAEEDIFLTDVDKYYASDYFHPSGDGYGIWYKDIKNKLN